MIGVCRGFHFLQHLLKGQIVEIKGYAGEVHTIQGLSKRCVTTHCRYGFKETPMDIISFDENRVIMSAEDKIKNFYGQLWHPERAMNQSQYDVKVFRKHWRLDK